MHAWLDDTKLYASHYISDVVRVLQLSYIKLATSVHLADSTGARWLDRCRNSRLWRAHRRLDDNKCLEVADLL